MPDAGIGERGSAVFLDRDGVINRRRADHVKSWAEFEFLPGVLEALSELHELGARVVVITNQAAVGRGLLTEGELALIHARMGAAVAAAGGRIEETYACVHLPETGCSCRKPRVALFHQAALELGIRLESSVMVGDAPSDIQAARTVGCLPVLLADQDLPEHGSGVTVVRNLAGVVRLFRQASPVTAC